MKGVGVSTAPLRRRFGGASVWFGDVSVLLGTWDTAWVLLGYVGECNP